MLGAIQTLHSLPIGDDRRAIDTAARRSAAAPGGSRTTPRRSSALLVDEVTGPKDATLTVEPRTVILGAVLRGTAVITTDRGGGELPAGTVVLLARPGEATLRLAAVGAALVARLDRVALQIAASKLLRTPSRAARYNVRLPATADTAAALAALLTLREASLEPRRGADAVRADEQALFDRLVAAVRARTAGPALFRPVPAAARAIAALEAQPGLDPEAMARAARVTPRTLRAAFAETLGVPLAGFVRATELTRARARLASGYETRSLAEIARTAGFSSGAAFTRAYLRAFGESPTQTRTRAAHGHERDG